MISEADTFWSKVDKRRPGECWPWLGSMQSAGYGVLSCSGRAMLAHRLAWEAVHGAIPTGEGFHGTCVLHRCDNRRCVNPDHLFLGTQKANVADMRAKGRHARGERMGSAKLTEAQVLDIRRSNELQRVLADRFGVSQSQVSRIRAGVNW